MDKIISLLNQYNLKLIYPIVVFISIFFFIELLIKIKLDRFVIFIFNSIIYNSKENLKNTNRNIFILNYLKNLNIYSSNKSIFYTNGFYKLLQNISIKNRNLIYFLKSDNRIDSKLLISSVIIDCLEHKNRNYNKIFRHCALVDIDHNEITYQMNTEEIMSIFQNKYKKYIIKSFMNKNVLPKSVIVFYRENFVNEIKHEKISKAVRKFIMDIKSNMDHDALIITLDYSFGISPENISQINTYKFLIDNNDLKLTQDIHFKGIDLSNYNFLKRMGKYDNNLFLLESINIFWSNKFFYLTEKVIGISFSKKRIFNALPSTPFKIRYERKLSCNGLYSFLILVLYSSITIYFKNIIISNQITHISYVLISIIVFIIAFYILNIKSFFFGIEKINFKSLINWKPKIFESKSKLFSLIMSNIFTFSMLFTTHFTNVIILLYTPSNKNNIINNNRNTLLNSKIFYLTLLVILISTLLLFFIYKVKKENKIKKLIYFSQDPIEVIFESKSIYELLEWIKLNPDFFLKEKKHKNELIKILHEWAFGYVNNYPYKWKRGNNTPYSGAAWDLIYEIERYSSIKYQENLVQEKNPVIV